MLPNSIPYGGNTERCLSIPNSMPLPLFRMVRDVLTTAHLLSLARHAHRTTDHHLPLHSNKASLLQLKPYS